jgi:PAS domain S-box-containing protein
VDRLRADVASTAGAVQTEAGERAGALRDLRAEVALAADALGVARQDLAHLRAEAADLRGLAQAAPDPAAGVEQLRGELDAVRSLLQEYRAGFEEARQAAVLARREAEQARRAVEETPVTGRATVAAPQTHEQRLADAMHQILGMAAQGQRPASRGVGSSGAEEVRMPPRRQLRRDADADANARPPRAGFDDVAHPMAVLALDGHFKELNPAFARLVGYGEKEFAKAVWPSVHDRAVFKQQQEQLTRLAAGTLESVRIQSTFLHGQGLMVLISGTLSLVRDAQGAPSHLLIEAEDRQTAG